MCEGVGDVRGGIVIPPAVMAGLDPATHVFLATRGLGVGTRVKPAHDDGEWTVMGDAAHRQPSPSWPDLIRPPTSFSRRMIQSRRNRLALGQQRDDSRLNGTPTRLARSLPPLEDPRERHKHPRRPGDQPERRHGEAQDPQGLHALRRCLEFREPIGPHAIRRLQTPLPETRTTTSAAGGRGV